MVLNCYLTLVEDFFVSAFRDETTQDYFLPLLHVNEIQLLIVHYTQVHSK